MSALRTSALAAALWAAAAGAPAYAQDAEPARAPDAAPVDAAAAQDAALMAAPGLAIEKGEAAVAILGRAIQPVPGASVKLRGRALVVAVRDSGIDIDLPVDDDATIARAHLGGGVLAITLHHGASTTARIAALSRVEVLPGGLRMIMPRKQALEVLEASAAPSAPAAWTIETIDAATASAQAEANDEGTAAAPPVVAGVVAAPTTTPPPAAPTPSAAPALADEPGDDVAPAAVGVTATAESPTTTAETPAISMCATGTTSSSTSWAIPLAGLGAIVFGAVAWMRRKRPDPEDDIQIVASRALSGKSRLVLVRTGERELLLSVNEKQSQVLSRWGQGRSSADVSPRGGGGFDGGPRTPGPADDPVETIIRPRLQSVSTRGRTSASRAAQPAPAPAAPAAPASPAVAGLLKLRRTAAPAQPPALVPLDDEAEVPEDDTDSHWAEELIQAEIRRRAS